MTMNSTSKRKEETVMSDGSVKKKLSHNARYNKKRRLERERKSIVQDHNTIAPVPTIVSITDDIIFDPNRHRTQYATRGLCVRDKILYIEKEWKSIPLNLLDCVASKGDKNQENILVDELLLETLIREAMIDNIRLPEVPVKFLTLVDDEIIKAKCVNNGKRRTDNLDEHLWISFGQWLGMKEPLTRRDVRQYLRHKWKKIKHAIGLRNSKVSPNVTTERISRKKKTQLIISSRDNLYSLKNLIQFRYIVKSECVTDMNGRTLIHLEQFIDQNTVTQATSAVNTYYFHTLHNPSHRSNEFWSSFIEHFGVYALYNILPYTSSNTASSHNIDHLECVNKLLLGLVSLSDSINRFIESYYESLYKKLSELKWGTFAPRPFGVFPMIAINFNTRSDFHWDEHDDPNSLCCLVALGDFDGGELCFPQLQIVVPLKPGQIVVFSSRFLLHGNLPITRGIRHSIVYFIHSVFFHDFRDFSSIYNDLEKGIERDARGIIVPEIRRQDLNDAQNLNSQIKLDKPKSSQIRIPPASTDCRRGHIDLRRARRGLRAEDPLSDIE